MASKKILALLAVVVIVLILVLSIKTTEENVVVVYVAHDQDYSEPILEEFEKISGIKVKALYDSEATKTVGLVNRLLAEKSNPQADVFWNNEVMRTILLKENDLLQPYCSPNAKDIPADYKDSNCYWNGFGARARAVMYNKEKIGDEEKPTSIFNLSDARWKGETCIANPLLGSTSTHAAALFSLLGDEKAKEFFLELKENNIQVLESNSMVRDQVVAGECFFGLTDTDDAYDAVNSGKPVEIVFPDQGEDEIGTLVFPNSVMLIKNSPHTKEGRKLIDFLLSPKVEEDLYKSALQIPLKASSQTSVNLVMKDMKPLNITWDEIYKSAEESKQFIQNVFLS